MNINYNFRELKHNLSSDKIISILKKYNIYPISETDKYIIYPTICHNLNSNNPKLYYYKDSCLFKCYTQCQSSFDIFELLIKINTLRGIQYNIFNAIQDCDLTIKPEENIEQDDKINDLYNLIKTKSLIKSLPILSKEILNRYIYDENAFDIWIKEGINLNSIIKYNIKYDPIQNCIIIPNYDIDNNLISIRGRFLNEDSTVKYKPINYNNKVLSHPSSMSLYGLNFTKNKIQQIKKVIIFEGEKSVLKMDTIYNMDNFSVAVLGKHISSYQIRTLIKLGVNEVILAFDKDYNTFEEMEKVKKEYSNIAKTLKPFFNTCYLMDLNGKLLGYKDSPIDKGRGTFEKLIENRIYV